MTLNVDVKKIFSKIRNQWDAFFSKEENSDHYFNLIKDFIHRKLNFEMSMYRDRYLKGRLYHRIKSKKYGNFKNYCLILQENPSEMHHLKSLLTIHTTSFFRDITPFQYLEQVLLPKISQQISNPNIPIQILSAPCSTGQEAYSLAIIAHELRTKHIIKNPIMIYGIDIDEESINISHKGIYKFHQTKNIPPSYLDKYFIKLPRQEFQIKKEIKNYCSFSIHDIFKSLPYNFKFDLILCRNLLIYISTIEQNSVIENLKKNARKFSYFMLGNTEGISLFSNVEFREENSNEHIFQYTQGSQEISGFPARKISSYGRNSLQISQKLEKVSRLEQEVRKNFHILKNSRENAKKLFNQESDLNIKKVKRTSYDISQDIHDDNNQDVSSIISGSISDELDVQTKEISYIHDSNLDSGLESRVNLEQDINEHQETMKILEALEQAKDKEFNEIVQKSIKIHDETIQKKEEIKKLEALHTTFNILNTHNQEKDQDLSKIIKEAKILPKKEILDPDDLEEKNDLIEIKDELAEYREDIEEKLDDLEFLNEGEISDYGIIRSHHKEMHEDDAHFSKITNQKTSKLEDQEISKVDVIKILNDKIIILNQIQEKEQNEERNFLEKNLKGKNLQLESQNNIKEIHDHQVVLSILRKKQENETKKLARIIQEAKKMQKQQIPKSMKTEKESKNKGGKAKGSSKKKASKGKKSPKLKKSKKS